MRTGGITLNPMAGDFTRGNSLLGISMLFVAFAMSTWLSARIFDWFSWKPHWAYLCVMVVMVGVAGYRQITARVKSAFPVSRLSIIFCLLWIGLEAVFYFIKQNVGPTPVFKAHIVSALLFLGFLIALSEESLWRYAQWGTRMGVIAGALLCLAQVYLPGLLTVWDQGRSAGLTNDPNSAALALSLGYFVTAWAILPRYRVPYVALCMSGLIATMSRTHMIAFILGVALLALFGYFRGIHSRRQILTSIILAGFFFTIAYQTQAVFRFAINGQFGYMPQAIAYLEKEVVSTPPAIHISQKSVPAKTASEVPPELATRGNEVNQSSLTGVASAPPAIHAERNSTGPRTASTSPDIGPLESELKQLSMVVRIERMLNGLTLLKSLPRFGIDSVQEAAERSGHNAILFYLLAYGFIGAGLVPLFLLALWSGRGDKRVLAPFSVALLISVAGFQDPLADWGIVIFGAAMLYAQVWFAAEKNSELRSVNTIGIV